MDRERLMKMAGAVRTGGKGSMRRFDSLSRLIKYVEFYFVAYSTKKKVSFLLERAAHFIKTNIYSFLLLDSIPAICYGVN